MRKASAAFRLLAPSIAVGVLVVGCGPNQATPPPTTPRSAAPVPAETSAADKPRTIAPSPSPLDLPVGSLYRNPANNRDEVVLADVRHTAVLIGDSQAMPKDSWPQRGISALGYKLHVVGMGGTGFVASNGKTGNYIDALQRGDWLLPYGDPPLIVVQGGGNDATQKATDAQISSNAERLLAALKKRYPGARLAMIGTLARGADNGGGRRSEVDALLGRIAAKQAIPFVSAGDWLTRYDAVADLQDGVHMKPSGHAKLGTVLARELGALGLTARPDTDTSVSSE
ncbi:SGNH/GDSL hydrolase family protein [Paenarthrobacter aromaticivorans]|uniref:SGNH/GDSL hydrolase family protein n=1 Tax=Paenarthrobacter aromaticivorans TaxID=2849150 RepID=A0ABS6I8H4_9MICC|nr:SGNH/GDSL hydrolase family protein [Paenarthrobacter sp. MMS21-TAE1-1]MBU8867066.1 SGNH/GDSL hydrolase family protein [Paenarthrobacter sp. MMS21-TAE1-1]